MPSTEDIQEALYDVIDPELGINVVDLGLVYRIVLEDKRAIISMTLTSAACPLVDVMEDQVNEVLEGIVEDVTLQWVWVPPWDISKVTPEGREMLSSLGFNV